MTEPKGNGPMTTPIQVGQRLASLTRTPTELMLFSFAAATWNQHRLHYDRDYANAAGFRDLVVEGNLQGAWLAEIVLKFAGPGGSIAALSYRHVRSAYVNEPISVTGVVTAVRAAEAVLQVDCRLEVTSGEEICTVGDATAVFPAADESGAS